MNKDKKLIFELSHTGRCGVDLPECDVPKKYVLPENFLRCDKAKLPELSQLDVVRHYTNLSQRNFGLDAGFYPLGSCTMKYNPKINEVVCRLPGFALTHPLQPEELSQGCLKLMFETQKYLAEISGMDEVCLQPAAGAHGELVGMKLIKAYHRHNKSNRNKVIVPDSAHGTNPATATVCGMDVVQIQSHPDGSIDLQALKDAVGDDTAAIMLTNPSTLGLFESNIKQIAQIVHDAGGLLYYDGANANAIMGLVRPGDMGFDVIHFNVHKTFSTPHGGGGPGAGPIGVKKELMQFLPVPLIKCENEVYSLDYERPLSIGKIHAFFGNFGVIVRTYAYILAMGGDGLKQASLDAILAANYCLASLKEAYDSPFNRYCMHECVLTSKKQKPYGVKTLDIAKRLLDYGYHPPTIYFPLIVEEALMIEPTETESKETLDDFIDAMLKIAKEAQTDSTLVTTAPQDTVVSRLDEASAARKPVVIWQE